MSTIVTKQTIFKQSGEEVPFKRYKIQLILNLLALTVEQEDRILLEIDKLQNDQEITTAMIYNLILKALKRFDLSKAAIFEKKHIEAKDEWQLATDPTYKIGQLISHEEDIMHENANKDAEVFNTFRDLTAGMVGKSLGLKMLPERVAKAHLRGDIHWHDLDYSPLSPMTNCCLVDFKHMFEYGYKMGNAYVDTPKSIGTATAQMAQIIANIASCQYGGISINRADELLAPYAAMNYKKYLKQSKEYMPESQQKKFATEQTKKDIYNAMEALEYEINTLSSAQGQTPFTTLAFGLGTDWLSRTIQKAILNIRIKGIGPEHRTAIFPKLVFSLKKGTNLDSGDPNYDIKKLAIECATKRMYPDVLNYDKIIDITGSFKAPMGCRSFLQGWRDAAGNEVNEGRMNLGVVTINIPRIALSSHGNINLFWKILADRLSLTKLALQFRVKRTKNAKPENAPILYQSGAFGSQTTQHVDELFKNGRATVSVGYIGLYEVGAYFFGQDWESNDEARAFTLDIVKRLNQACHEWEKEDGYHYSVYSTPAESLTDKFCELDKEKFGIVSGVTDKDYYTNSFHYDVRKHPNPFEKLLFEEPYPYFASGGFIHYCEYPNLKQNPAALEAVWDFAYNHVGYLGTNTPIDQCFKCGYEGEFKPTARGFCCPECGNHDPKTCDVVKRTCGYLGNPQARPMIHGRHKEIISRVKNISERELN
ncbi:anaerobic ribonucleoside-triphosphate reductase [Leuconostoc palmae]|uniref:anaerobic ribonucleoside-triphosphate reductase n=1 Tax=Leuconostoc palmae TaxID=501487 RepID=UPI001C7D74F7|nr:anaerobic ribonucleoside-triphosphate reductase [Leuconostoc palmae]